MYCLRIAKIARSINESFADAIAKANMLDFDKICRVCMRTDRELLLIFDDKYDDEEASIVTMLNECSKHKVQRFDVLPQHICDVCMGAVRNAYHFKQECDRSYQQMIQILSDNCVEPVMAECDMYAEKGTQTDVSALYPCERCDKKFFIFDELRLHRENQHKGSAIMCRLCSKSFSRIGYLKTHFAVFHPELGYISHNQCHICQRQFTRREHMRRHLAVIHKIVDSIDLMPEDENAMSDGSETNEKYVQDMIMEASPSNPIETVLINDRSQENNTFGNLEEENYDIEDNISESSNNKVPMLNQKCHQIPSAFSSCSKELKLEKREIEPNSAKIFFCEKREKSCVNKAQCKRHRTSRHNDKAYECNICHKTFTRRIYLDRHLSIHGRTQFTCKECAQNFISKEEMTAHRKAEGHDKPMLCPECGLRCKTSSILMVHMRRHNGEKPFKCKFCNKGFPRTDDLRVHEKYHTGEKSHFCETCGKGFQRKYNLTIHLRVHTGEKPYKCPHCPQAFAQRNDLKSHIRRHTGERFRCEFCDAAFLQGYQIRQHKLTEHGIKEEPPTQRVAKFTSAEQQEQQIKEILQLKTS